MDDDMGIRTQGRRQTSFNAGTTMHGIGLLLKTSLLTAHVVATHSRDISTLQLQC